MPLQSRGQVSLYITSEAATLACRRKAEGQQLEEVRTSGSSDSSIPSSAGALNRERLAQEGFLVEASDRTASSSMSPSANRQTHDMVNNFGLEEQACHRSKGRGRGRCGRGRGAARMEIMPGNSRHWGPTGGEIPHSSWFDQTNALDSPPARATRAFSPDSNNSDHLVAQAASEAWLGQPIPFWAQLDMTCNSIAVPYADGPVSFSDWRPQRTCVCHGASRVPLSGEAPRLCELCGGNMQCFSRRKGRRRRGRWRSFHVASDGLC
mmetsp:Transcript_46508/g.108404  ORF Transcript_46508/g.108404 Transcript_46508/m.108404 type:complete len:265 (-) Transcript_46508:29-823(-)